MTLESRVKSAINEYSQQYLTNIQESHRLSDDLGLDSLDKVELVMDLEDEFNIVILEDDMAIFVTVQDVIDCVQAEVTRK